MSIQSIVIFFTDNFLFEYFTLIKFQTKEFVCKGHTDSVDQLTWSPTNSDVFATASGDKTVRLWDARTGKSASTISTKGCFLVIANSI